MRRRCGGRHRRGRRGEERGNELGAVAILVAVLMSTVLVAVTAYAVDLGVQRVARTDMQSLADVVSLDLARELDGRTAGEIAPLLATYTSVSVQRNGGTVGDAPVVASELGYVDPDDGSFSPVTGTAVPNAVRVTTSTEVDFAFGLADRGAATGDAVASATPGGCVKIGSSALDLNSGSSTLLAGLLGDALGVSVLSYTGLLGSQLVLADLAAALGAGTADELLATEVSVADLLVAIAEVVARDDDPANDGVADVLSASVLQAVEANATLGRVRGGRLLALGQGDDAALASTVDVVDLVTASAFVANGDNALAVPGASLPAGVTASLYVVEAPRLACGRGVAETAQLRLVLDQSLPLVSALGTPLGSVDVRVTLSLAKARGGVASVDCADGAPVALGVRIDQASLVDLEALVAVRLLALPPTIASVPTVVPASGSGGTHSVPLPTHYDEVFRVPGSGSVGIPPVGSAQLGALGLDLGGALVAPVVAATVDSALQGLSGTLTSVLVPLLGLRVAGVDLLPVREAACVNPSLVG